MIEAAGSILLGLTKCNDQGYWIKSMFGVPEKVPTDDENKNLAEVRIHTLNDDGSVSRVNITVDKSNLANITSYGIETKNIPADKPW